MLKSVDLVCDTLGCKEADSGEKKSGVFRVESLNSLQQGDAVEDLCKGCGNQLRVALSAPRLAKGARESTPAPIMDGSRETCGDGVHVVHGSTNDVKLEFDPQRGVGVISVREGSPTEKAIRKTVAEAVRAQGE